MRGFVFPWLLIWCKGLDREIMAADPMVHLTADPTANTIQVATSNVATNAKLPPAQQPAPPEVLRRSNGNGKEARKLTAPILLLDQNSSAIPPSIAKYLRLSPDLNGRMCNFNVKKWKDIDGSIFTKEYHTWSLTHSTELANCVKADYVGHAEDKSVTHSHDLKKLKYHNLLRCLIQQVAQCPLSIVEVGSAMPPLVEMLPDFKKRTVIVQNSPGLDKPKADRAKQRLEASGIHVVTSTFEQWPLPKAKYDVALASQVIEHVKDPSAFLQRMLKVGRLVVVSAPYDWGKAPGHVTNHIKLKHLHAWANRTCDAFLVVSEPDKKHKSKRVVALWHT
mmetsp:Transcript_103433/g.297187  ORF Transcript_103433/g.297187 Transcript_103433/m.297187 type:complete len:335 (-) Transcript_103433:187-1191(-)